MSSGHLRERLTFVAMSAFVAWHTLAMMTAPLPYDSDLAQRLRSVFTPYLTLFQLDTNWDSLPPTLGKRAQLRYVVEDGEGRRHVFMPMDELSRFHPAFRAMGSWHREIMESPDTHIDYAAEFFCRKHAELKPKSVTFLEIEEDDYRPSHRLRGQQPRDPELVAILPVTTAECQN